MKKIFYSLFLIIVILFSLGINAQAEESPTTTVSYTGKGTEWYKLTVPAKLIPGETGTVILEGTWPSDRKVVVTADETVDLQNDINNTIKTLDIGFNGIEQLGDNYNEIYTTENISVANIEGALFGNWSGTFYYNVGFEKKSVSSYASTFTDNSWSDIINAVQTDIVPETWAIGDTKPMTIDGTEYNIQIIGKDHDTYTSGGTAPLTFQLVELCNIAYPMNATDDNTTGWSGSVMRTIYLSDILSTMPFEVQSAIKSVDKQTLKGDKSGLEITSDKLFLLSEVEVFGSTNYSGGYPEGSRYAFYANSGSTVKTFNTIDAFWWLRGPYYNSDSYFSRVFYLGGYIDGNVAGYGDGVSFAFCF